MSEAIYALFLNLSVTIFLFLSPFSEVWAKIGLILMSVCNSIYFISAFCLKKEGQAIVTLRTPLNRGLLLFGISAVISIIFSISPYHSQKIFFNRYFLYLLCFYTGYNYIKSDRDSKFFVFIFLVSGMVLGLGGMIYYFYFHPVRLHFSWYINVDIATFALLFLPFVFVYIFHTNKDKLSIKIIAWLSFIFMSVCLLLNYSRASFISAVLGIFCVLLFNNGVKRRDFIFLGLFAFLFLMLFYEFKSERLLDPRTWIYRSAYIKEGFALFKSSPFIGRGLGSFELLKFVHPAVTRQALHVENLYVEILAQGGLFGLLAFCYLFWLYFKQFTKRIGKLRNYELAASASIFASLIYGFLSSTIIVGVTMSFIFWFLAGISISRMRLNIDEKG